MVTEKEKVVFLIYHGQGHFNACFKLAKILQPSHEVIFAGFSFFKPYVEAQGFSYHALHTVPFGLGFERWISIQEKKKPLAWHVIKDRWTNRLYHLRESELTSMMKKIKPYYLLIDSWQSTDFIALYPYLKTHLTRLAFVQTMLSTIVHPQLPPLNSPVLPTSNKDVERAISTFRRARFKKAIIDKIKFLGNDNQRIITQRINENAIPTKYILDKPSIFSISFQHIPEFILAPRELDFNESVVLPHQHFIGPMLDMNRKEIADTEYLENESAIFKKIQISKLVYCSFGSISFEEVERLKKFLRNLSTVIKRNHLVCIVSSGSETIAALKDELNEDIYYFKSVPQLKILQHAAVFITHGGLNSIKESIETETPMLVYPVSSDYDQNGNAARVVYHNLGLMGDLEHDNDLTIEQKISALLTNKMYQENLKRFKVAQSSYSAEMFVKLFETLTPID